MAAQTACPTCYFGATSTKLYSFPYDVIETITANVVPQVIVYSPNSTSLAYSTQLNAALGGSNITRDGTGPIYTDVSEMVWTVSGVRMSYPTTYVQYIGFEKAAIPSSSIGDFPFCSAQASPTAVDLSVSTNGASFIYPLARTTSGVAQTALPADLLQYLDAFGQDNGFNDFEGVQGCGALPDSGFTFPRLFPRQNITGPANTTSSILTTSTDTVIETTSRSTRLSRPAATESAETSTAASVASAEVIIPVVSNPTATSVVTASVIVAVTDPFTVTLTANATATIRPTAQALSLDASSESSSRSSTSRRTFSAATTARPLVPVNVTSSLTITLQSQTSVTINVTSTRNPSSTLSLSSSPAQFTGSATSVKGSGSSKLVGLLACLAVLSFVLV